MNIRYIPKVGNLLVVGNILNAPAQKKDKP